METERLLQQGLETMGLDVSVAQQARLMEYLALMRKWNKADRKSTRLNSSHQ